MPNINFPNVPIAEGVPNLARSAYSLAQRTGATGRVMGLTGGLAGTFLGQYLNAMLSPSYALLDRKGDKLIQPDGPGEFEMKGDANVSTYPIEDGAFQSYNKVLNPENLAITLLCNGHGPMSRKQFIERCRELKNGTEIVTVVTPDQVYQSVVCTGMSYKQTSRNGATLLTVHMTFNEERTSASMSFPKAKTDSGSALQEGGQTETRSGVETTIDDWGLTGALNKIRELMGDAKSAIEGEVGRYFGKHGIG